MQNEFVRLADLIYFCSVFRQKDSIRLSMKRRLYTRFVAVLLLAVYAQVLLVKDFHRHDVCAEMTSVCCSIAALDDAQPCPSTSVLTADCADEHHCPICDFTFSLSTAAVGYVQSPVSVWFATLLAGESVSPIYTFSHYYSLRAPPVAG